MSLLMFAGCIIINLILLALSAIIQMWIDESGVLSGKEDLTRRQKQDIAFGKLSKSGTFAFLVFICFVLIFCVYYPLILALLYMAWKAFGTIGRIVLIVLTLLFFLNMPMNPARSRFKVSNAIAFAVFGITLAIAGVF